MTKTSLVTYFVFIVILLSVTIFITLYFFEVFPLYMAITLVSLLVLSVAGWMIKLLFAPLFQASKNIDDIIKETLHELNIPLATIDANTTMLKKKLNEEKQVRQLQRIHQASSHLLYLHKRLNYLIKKEFHEPPLEAIELQKFILERVEAYETLYPHAIFHLELKPLTIESDPFGLQQTLDNIISNSIKYSPNPPKITIRLYQDILEIEDQGKGMDENTILQIFQRYYQADTTQKGEGIGLSVVKKFCDAQKIRLNITSKPDRFTKVVLQFQPKTIIE